MQNNENFGNLIQKYDIEIPMIQRDYAQGRDDDKSTKIRQKFLADIYNGLENKKPLHMDFIFGSIKNSKFIPLDGQQRLTTLFLLYFYFGLKSGDVSFLKSDEKSKFRYETRASSREFCDMLLNLDKAILNSENLSESIKDSANFLPFWENDPTVKSMLNMLDDIDKKFKDQNFTKDTLDENLTFQLFELKEFNLSDELYIKMNARGKKLTEFEKLKARMEKILKENGFDDRLREFSEKMDNDWADIFWEYKDDKFLIDDAFMAYFRYISQMLYHKDNQDSEFDFDKELENIYKNKENLEFLFYALDNLDTIIDKINECLGSFKFIKFSISKNKKLEEFKNLNIRNQVLIFIIINGMKNEIEDEDLDEMLRFARSIMQMMGYWPRAKLDYQVDVRSEYINVLIGCFLNINSIYDDKFKSNIKNLKSQRITDENRSYQIKKLDLIKKSAEFKKLIFEFEDHDEIKANLNGLLDDDFDKFKKRKEAFFEIFSQDDDLVAKALLTIAKDNDKDEYDSHRVWIGRGAGYEKWFYGKKGYWRLILDKKIRYIISLIKKYEVKNLEDVIEDCLNEYKNNPKDYIYYFLKYDEFLNEIEDERVNIKGKFSNVFIWRGKPYDVEKMSGTNISSMYINPYLYAAFKNYKEANFYRDENYYSCAKIEHIIDKVFCNDDGWYIKFSDEILLPNEKLKKLETGEGEYKNYFILKHDENEDTIKNLQTFLDEIL